MRSLSAIDASFLYAEAAPNPMHVAALQIYDPSAAPDRVDRQRIVEQVMNRAHLIDCFHNKLITTPWHLDHPLWVEDTDFDAERHVSEETLPAPGDWSALQGAVARLVAEPLPRDRPLWQMHLIHGLHGIQDLPENAFAIFTKIHHAAVDGVAGIGVTAALHDLQPDTNVVQIPRRDSETAAVNKTGLAAAGLYKEMLRPLRTYAALPALSQLANSLRGAPLPPRAPNTPLNRLITKGRTFDALQIPLPVVQACRQLVAGATVNDVFLSLIGGALRRYLEHHGELPTKSLTTLVPMSTHADLTQINTGNQVSQIIASLGTDIAQGEARLQQVHAATKQAKAAAKQMDAAAIDTVTALAPAAMVEFAARRLPRAALPFNTVVTNVKGPPVPFYLCGAELIRGYGMGPLAGRLGVFHTILSYRGEVSLSVLACDELMPDLQFYMACLQQELHTFTSCVADPTRATK